MPQFLILARDGNEPEALSRRLNARPFHLETARQLKANGHFIVGGATVNENGEMNGSMMVVEFADEAEMRQWLDNDPYVQMGVWQEISVQPFRVATV